MMVPPEYNKPDAPGVVLGDDGLVGVYHIVEESVDFDKSAQAVFDLLRRAQKEHPGIDRVLYIDINGHRGDVVGFDQDFFEFQQEFLQGFLGPFFAALDMPLSSVFNPNEQRNDVPDIIDIAGPRSPGRP